jgi:hypothetical protein
MRRCRSCLNQPGMHNVQNACAAIAIARELGVADADTQKALTEFNGVGRRFTRYGDVQLRWRQAAAFTLVDDYGHHPVETAGDHGGGARRLSGPAPGAGVPAAPLYAHARLVRRLRQGAVRDRRAGAGRSVCGRRAPIVAADGRALAHALRVAGKVEPVFVESIADMPATILKVVRDGDVVITMGAGSIGGVPAKLAALQKVASRTGGVTNPINQAPDWARSACCSAAVPPSAKISMMSGTGVLQALRSQGRRRPCLRPGRASPGRTGRGKIRPRVHRAARPLRRRRHAAGRAGAARHSLHRQRRDGVLVAMDKITTKIVWLAHGVPTPRIVRSTSTTHRPAAVVAILGLPLIVKAPLKVRPSASPR